MSPPIIYLIYLLKYQGYGFINLGIGLGLHGIEMFFLNLKAIIPPINTNGLYMNSHNTNKIRIIEKGTYIK